MLWNNKVLQLSYCGVIIALIILLKLVYLNIPFVYVGILGISTNAPEIYLIPLFILIFLLDFKHQFTYSFFLYVVVAVFSSLVVWIIVPLTFYVGSIFFDYVFIFLAPLVFIPFALYAMNKKSKYCVMIGVILTHLIIFATHSSSSIIFFSTLKLHNFSLIVWALLYNVGYVFINCLLVMVVLNVFLKLIYKKKFNV